MFNRGADPRARRMGAPRSGDHSRRAQSGRVPCSGAERRDKVLDEVSTAIHGGAAAVNVANQPRRFLASAGFALCTPGMGVNLWGVSPLCVDPVNVVRRGHKH